MSQGKSNRRQVFINKLKSATSEDDVIKSFCEYFKLNEARMKEERIDLLLPNVLFEFKYDENFGKNRDHVGKVVAQAIHYVREIFDGRKNIDRIPQFISIVDKNEAFILKVKDFETFYHNEKDYNWNLPASSPDEKLAKTLANYIASKSRELNHRIFNTEKIDELKVFQEVLIQAIKGNSTDILKKKITSKNFQSVFPVWKSTIGKMLETSLKKETTFKDNFAPYFISDLSTKSIYQGEQKKLLLEGENGTYNSYAINVNTYQEFWSQWEKPTENEFEIISRIRDRIAPDDQRRNAGAFYTDPSVAMKAYEYLESVYGKDFWRTYKIWDMCAGTGNLELGFPEEAQLYLSTLDSKEIPHLQRVYPNAHSFSFDFLNGDYSQLPAVLRADLENKNNKWIVLMNPPYATSRSGKDNDSKLVQNEDGETVGVYNATQVKKEMDQDGLSKSGMEAINQFIYRSLNWIPNLQLAILCKPKIIVGRESGDIRRSHYNGRFKRGFLVSSETFYMTKGKFPIIFSIFDFTDRVQLTEQKLVYDVFQHEIINHKNTDRELVLHKICEKQFKIEEDNIQYLDKWFPRPKIDKKNFRITPPMKSAVALYDKKIWGDKAPISFLGYICLTGNDLSQQNLTIIYSSIHGGNHGFYITEDNFEKSSVVFAVRRLPVANFVNDKDQFCQPTKTPSKEFLVDSVIYSLFHGSNQASSLSMPYNGRTYQITNEFYPFLKEELKSWDFYTENLNPQKVGKLTDKVQDRHTAKYLQQNAEHFSEEGKVVLEKIKLIYQYFYREEQNFNIDPKWELDNWDLGFYQIKSALEETERTDALELISSFRESYKALANKLRTQIVELGFIQDGVSNLNEELLVELKDKKMSAPKKEDIKKNQTEVLQLLEQNIIELEIDEIDLI